VRGLALADAAPLPGGTRIENPLLRSGLALAGANRGADSTGSEGGDGLLTAEEVLGLNLRGTGIEESFSTAFCSSVCTVSHWASYRFWLKVTTRVLGFPWPLFRPETLGFPPAPGGSESEDHHWGFRPSPCARPASRPVFHQRDDTIRGHVFCSFLALVLHKELQQRLAQREHQFEWTQIKKDLKELQLLELEENGTRMVIRTECKGCCGKVFQAVGVAPPPRIQPIEATA